jgi:hypothetical protein
MKWFLGLALFVFGMACAAFGALNGYVAVQNIVGGRVVPYDPMSRVMQVLPFALLAMLLPLGLWIMYRAIRILLVKKEVY